MSSADGGHSRAQSPSSLAASRFKFYHPYFTPEDTSILTNFRRGKFSLSHDEKTRQNACGLLEVLGARIGLCVEQVLPIVLRNSSLFYDSPRRTIATAQALYHRFHLYFSKKDFNYFVSPYYLEVEFDKQPDLIGCLPRRSLRFDQDA